MNRKGSWLGHDLYTELRDEAYQQGFWEDGEADQVAKTAYYYNSDMQVRDALDWSLDVDSIMHWLILKELFDINVNKTLRALACNGLDFTETGMQKLLSDVELYEKIVDPKVNSTTLQRLAKDIGVEITPFGVRSFQVWNIPVEWTLIGTAKVKASSLEEAMEIVKKDKDIYGEPLPLPDDGVYLEDSFRASYHDADELLKYQ